MTRGLFGRTIRSRRSPLELTTILAISMPIGQEELNGRLFGLGRYPIACLLGRCYVKQPRAGNFETLLAPLQYAIACLYFTAKYETPIIWKIVGISTIASSRQSDY